MAPVTGAAPSLAMSPEGLAKISAAIPSNDPSYANVAQKVAIKAKFRAASDGLRAADPATRAQAIEVLSAARQANTNQEWATAEQYVDTGLGILGVTQWEQHIEPFDAHLGLAHVGVPSSSRRRQVAPPVVRFIGFRTGRRSGWLMDGIASSCSNLDNTLYHPASGLLEAGDETITRFISERLNIPWERANRMRVRTWREYGATARGLEVEHGIPQREFFAGSIEQVCVEDYIRPQPELRAMLQSLPQRLYVFTNAPCVYAARRCRRELADLISGVFDIETTAASPSLVALRPVLRRWRPGRADRAAETRRRTSRPPRTSAGTSSRPAAPAATTSTWRTCWTCRSC